jgi:chromosome segregation protein
LDEANSRRFAKILEDLSIRTQIITITHNRATMEIAQQLYGLTMNEEGISKLVSLKLEEAKKT